MAECCVAAFCKKLPPSVGLSVYVHGTHLNLREIAQGNLSEGLWWGGVGFPWTSCASSGHFVRRTKDYGNHIIWKTSAIGSGGLMQGTWTCGGGCGIRAAERLLTTGPQREADGRSAPQWLSKLHGQYRLCILTMIQTAKILAETTRTHA